MRTCLAVLALLLPALPTDAAGPCPGTIDQSQDLFGPGTHGSAAGSEVAQTFTRSLPGPWVPVPEEDAQFRTYLCPLVVALEPDAWGHLKARHR